jgi:UrcA family protein
MREPLFGLNSSRQSPGARELINSNETVRRPPQPFRHHFVRFKCVPLPAHIGPAEHQQHPVTQPEIAMNTNASIAKAFLCVAGAAACALLSGPIQAGEQIVTIKESVSLAGIDASQPADARKLYSRVQKAAHIVCGPSNRVGLRSVDNIGACYEKALGDAVRSANLPQLTMVYLHTHSPEVAAARGIGIPVLVAAK